MSVQRAAQMARVLDDALRRQVSESTVDPGEAVEAAMVIAITLAVELGGRDWAMDLILGAAHAIRHSPELADLDLACAEPAGRA